MKELLKRISRCPENPLPKQVKPILQDICNNFNIMMVAEFGATKSELVFEKIWIFLMNCACNADVSIQILANRTADIFLAKAAPFYPKSVQLLFSKPNTRPADNCLKAYIFYVQTFTWMTHDIDPVYINSFVEKADAKQYFVSTDEETLEYIAKCIPQLRAINKEWYKELLDEYIDIIKQPKQELNYKKPLQDVITGILRQYPSLTEYLIDRLNEENEKMAQNRATADSVFNSLPIISNLISGKLKLDKADVHLYPFAKLSMRVFIEKNKNKSLADSAFVILSYVCKSFSVEVVRKDKNVDNSVYIITLKKGPGPKEESEKNISVIVDLSRFQNTSKYFLPIPVDDLIEIVQEYVEREKPTDNRRNERMSSSAHQSDIGKIMEALANVAKTAYTRGCTDIKNPEKKKIVLNKLSKTMKKYFDTFNEILTKAYDTVTIASLNAFASCVTYFVLPGIKQDLIYLLRMIFYMKAQDDTHRKSIFGVMSALGMDKVAQLLSQSAFEEFQDMAIDATLNCGDSYYEDFVKVLIEFARESGHEKVIELLFERLNPFETESLEKLFRTAAIIGEDAPQLDNYYLMSCIYTTLETVTYNEISLSFITSAFRFLSLFNLTLLQKKDNEVPPIFCDIPSLVSQILVESTNFITGSQLKSKQTRFDSETLRNHMKAIFTSCRIDTLTVDINGRGVGSRIDFYPQLYYTLRFYNSLPFVSSIAALFSNISDAIVQLFPVISSECFHRYFALLVKSDKMSIFKALTPHLNRFPNIDVAADWLNKTSDPTTWDQIAQFPKFKNALFKPLPLIPHLDTTGKYVKPRSILIYVKAALNSEIHKRVLLNEIRKIKPKDVVLKYDKKENGGDQTLDEDDKEPSEEDIEQYKNFMLLIMKQNMNVAECIVDKEDLPEPPVNFGEGVIKSMFNMVKTASEIYKKISQELNKGAKVLQSSQMSDNIANNLRSKIEDKIEDFYEPDFYVAQLEFHTIDIDQEHLENLLRYFCNIAHKNGILACLKYVAESNAMQDNKKWIDITKFIFPQSIISDVIIASTMNVTDKFEDFMDKYCNIKDSEDDTKELSEYFSNEAKFAGMCCYPPKIDRILSFTIDVFNEKNLDNLFKNLIVITRVLNASACDPWNTFSQNSYVFMTIISFALEAIEKDKEYLEYIPDLLFLIDTYFRHTQSLDKADKWLIRINKLIRSAGNDAIEMYIQLARDLLSITNERDILLIVKENIDNMLRSLDKHTNILYTVAKSTNNSPVPFDKAMTDEFDKCTSIYRYIDFMQLLDVEIEKMIDIPFIKSFIDKLRDGINKYKDVPFIIKTYSNMLKKVIPHFEKSRSLLKKQSDILYNIYNFIRKDQDSALFDLCTPAIPDIFVEIVAKDLNEAVDKRNKAKRNRDKEYKDTIIMEKIIPQISPINMTWSGIDVARNCVDKFVFACKNDIVAEDFILDLQKVIIDAINNSSSNITYTTSKLIDFGMYTAFSYLPTSGETSFMNVILNDFFQENQKFLPYFAALKEFMYESCPAKYGKHDYIKQLLDESEERERYNFVIMMSLKPRKLAKASRYARQISQFNFDEVDAKIAKKKRKRQ